MVWKINPAFSRMAQWFHRANEGKKPTSKSLEANQEKIQGLSQANDRLFQAQAQFDENMDSYLSKVEIEKALFDESTSVENKAVLSVLYDHFETFAQASNDRLLKETKGITTNDILHIEDYALANELEHLLSQALSENYQAREVHLTKIKEEPSVSNIDVLGTKPSELVQGTLGDCYFISSLIGVLQTQPHLVEDMVTNHKDGTYSVSFPDGTEVRVTSPEVDGLRWGESAGGNWLPIMEKAFAEYQRQHSLTNRIKRQDHMARGGLVSTALESLTGEKTSSFFFLRDVRTSKNKKKVHEILSEAKNHKKPVVVGSRYSHETIHEGSDTAIKKVMYHALNTLGDIHNHEEFGLRSNHAYTVLDYDPETQVITLHDPWGETDMKNHDGQENPSFAPGTFTISMNHFVEYFGSITHVRS